MTKRKPKPVVKPDPLPGYPQRVSVAAPGLTAKLDALRGQAKE